MHKMVDDVNGTLSDDEIRRLESIRDTEELLHMIAGIRSDPNVVALASARFGIMRMTQLYGRAYTIDFAKRCIENMDIAQQFSSD